MLVYKVTNKISNEAYIGQTTRPIEDRWAEHCKPVNARRSYVSNAIQKHGKENFTIEVLCKASSQEELDLLEKKYIEEHSTAFPNGYNLKEGGLGGSLSQEARLKISKTLMGRKISVETLNKRGPRSHTETQALCAKCEKWLDKEEFHKDHTKGRRGVVWCCKTCRSKHRSKL